MIVSTKDGGLIPCAGGSHRLGNYRVPSGHAAIRSLSWAEVDRIRERFEALNPWRDSLKTPFLKLEKENFTSDGVREAATIGSSLALTFRTLPRTTIAERSAKVCALSFCAFAIVTAAATRSIATNREGRLDWGRPVGRSMQLI